VLRSNGLKRAGRIAEPTALPKNAQLARKTSCISTYYARLTLTSTRGRTRSDRKNRPPSRVYFTRTRKLVRYKQGGRMSPLRAPLLSYGASLRTALGEDLCQAALEQIRTHAEALRQSAEIIQRRDERSADQRDESSETQQRAKQGFLTPRPLFSY
jgi:hypothetical protein